jgi:N-acetylmuramate 1-kinase
MIKADMRINALLQWLKDYSPHVRIEPIPNDASFRRYYRVFAQDNSLIAVDSPPEVQNNQAFVHIAQAFLQAKLPVPQVLRVDFDAGFLLLSDLGDLQLLNVINTSNMDYYYQAAMANLARLQRCQNFRSWQLPIFDSEMLLQELYYFHEWYLITHLKLELSLQEMTILQQAYELLLFEILRQPKVCVHKDYHSKNLMVLPDNRLGILDFQDALWGPVSYDVVSLLKDCYVNWQEERITHWLEQFWHNYLGKSEKAALSLAQFQRDFDWMCLQRHLKIIGIFARLYHRDQKTNYSQYIPRLLQSVIWVCERYREFSPLKKFLQERVIPK